MGNQGYWLKKVKDSGTKKCLQNGCITNPILYVHSRFPKLFLPDRGQQFD